MKSYVLSQHLDQDKPRRIDDLAGQQFIEADYETTAKTTELIPDLKPVEIQLNLFKSMED